MIEHINGLPENVAGFRASGKVTKEEYDRILIPAVEKIAGNTGKINYLFELDTDITNMSAGAWFDDLMLGAKHLMQWRKIAIVSDHSLVNNFAALTGHITPGEVKTFAINELEAAKKWVAE